MRWPWRELDAISGEIELLKLNTPARAALLHVSLDNLLEEVKRRRGSVRCLVPSAAVDLFWSRLEGHAKLSNKLVLLVAAAEDARARVDALSSGDRQWMLDEALDHAVTARCQEWRIYFEKVGSETSGENDANAEHAGVALRSQTVTAFTRAIQQLKSTTELLQRRHGRTSGRHRRSVRRLHRRLSDFGPVEEWRAELIRAHYEIASDLDLALDNRTVKDVMDDIDERLKSVDCCYKVLSLDTAIAVELEHVVPPLDESIPQQLLHVEELRRRRLGLKLHDDDDVPLVYALADEVGVAEQRGREVAARRSDQLIACVKSFRALLVDSDGGDVHQIDSVPQPAPVSASALVEWYQRTTIELDRLLQMGRERSFRLVQHVNRKQMSLRADCHLIRNHIVTEAVIADGQTLLDRIQAVAMPKGLPDALLALAALDGLAKDVRDLETAAKAAAAQWTAAEQHVLELQKQFAEARSLFADDALESPPAPRKVVEGAALEPQERQLLETQQATERAMGRLRHQIVSQVTTWREWHGRAATALPHGIGSAKLPPPPPDAAGVLQWAEWADAHAIPLEQARTALAALAEQLADRVDEGGSTRQGSGGAAHDDLAIVEGLLEEAKAGPRRRPLSD